MYQVSKIQPNRCLCGVVGVVSLIYTHHQQKLLINTHRYVHSICPLLLLSVYRTHWVRVRGHLVNMKLVVR